MKILVKKEMLAWSAGIFEGEGTITCRGRKTNCRDRGILIKVKMTDEDVIKQFHATVGYLGNFNGPYKKDNRKPVWIWQTAKFEHVQAVVCMLWPWLKSRRRAQIVKAFKLHHSTQPTYKAILRDPVSGRLLSGRFEPYASRS